MLNNVIALEESLSVRPEYTNSSLEYQVSNYVPPENSLSKFIYENNIEQLVSVIENNFNEDFINERDNVGITSSWTPLYWSVKLRRIECMKILLEAGANINLVINDCEECCGTVLDLATIRDDNSIEDILREYAEKEDITFSQSFKAIRTKIRGKAPAFNFKYYGKPKKEDNAPINNFTS